MGNLAILAMMARHLFMFIAALAILGTSAVPSFRPLRNVAVNCTEYCGNDKSCCYTSKNCATPGDDPKSYYCCPFDACHSGVPTDWECCSADKPICDGSGYDRYCDDGPPPPPPPQPAPTPAPTYTNMTRTAKWAFATSGGVSSSPTLSADGSVVYVGSNDKSLYAVNTADGSKKWAFATGSVVRSSPTLSADGRVVYVGSDDNSLYAVNTRTFECQPNTAQCTCDTCCHAYIPDGPQCVKCINEKCPLPPANECQASKHCNVCDACCQDYITDGAMCNACVLEQCK